MGECQAVELAGTAARGKDDQKRSLTGTEHTITLGREKLLQYFLFVICIFFS